MKDKTKRERKDVDEKGNKRREKEENGRNEKK